MNNDSGTSPINGSTLPTPLTLFAFIAIVLLAFFLRTNQLYALPPGMSYDEATSVVDGQQIAESRSYPLYEDIGSPEPLYQISLGIYMLFGGYNIFAARYFSALIGVLTVAAAYWSAYECLYDLPKSTRRLSALTAAAVLTLALGHITLSRALYRAIPQPLFMLLFVGSLIRGLRHGRFWILVLSAVFLAGAVYSYTAALAMPLSLLAVGASCLIFQARDRRISLPRLLVVVMVAAVLLLPLGVRFLTIPQSVIGRASAVAALAPTGTGGTFSVMLGRVPALVQQFFAYGDPNPQYNAANAPLLPPLFNILFLVGIAALLIRIRLPSSALIAALLVLSAVPVLATREVPHGLRVMGQYAAVPLIVALGMSLMVSLLSTVPAVRRRMPVILFGVLLIVTSYVSIITYQQYTGYFNNPRTLKMYSEELPWFEWFFRADRYEFSQWVTAQHQPLLIPLYELDVPTTRGWLQATYPKVTTADTTFEFPAKAQFVVPWSLELSGLMDQTPNYGLLKGNTITLLPPLSATTHAALREQLQKAERIDHKNGKLMARIVPLSAMGTVTFATPHPVGTVFNHEIALTGWYGADTLSTSQAMTVPYTLEWFARQPRLIHFYSSFLQLQTQNNEKLAGDDVLFWRWLFPSPLWKPSDKIPDAHQLTIPADLLPGAYRLVAGIYIFVDRPFEAVNQEGQTLGTSTTIGWVKVPQPTIPTIPPESLQLNGNFNDMLTLRAATAKRVSDDGSEGSQIEVSLYWQADQQRPPIDPTIFVHLIDANGTLVTQRDSRPWDGQYPVFIWDKGEMIKTTHTLDIGQADPDHLTLNVGMYTFPGPVRIPVVEDGTLLADAVLPVGKVSDLVNSEAQLEF